MDWSDFTEVISSQSKYQALKKNFFFRKTDRQTDNDRDSQREHKQGGEGEAGSS